MSYLLFSLFLFFSESTLAGTANHKAHVHGSAKVTLALETTTTGTIDLDVPAESIYGFEHKANSKNDKAAEDKGLKPLRGNPYSVVRLPTDCEVKVQKVEREQEKEEPGAKEEHDEHHGEHADITATYSVKCVNSLKGVKVWVPMFDVFPRVKAVSLQVLTPGGQVEKKFKNSSEFLVLP